MAWGRGSVRAGGCGRVDGVARRVKDRAGGSRVVRDRCLNFLRARLHIDNNLAERALRHFAVGRKSWLFFQTEGGGKTAAVLASLLQTARAIGLDPRVYFRDVLLRIGTETDVAKLTPHGWRQHFAREVADHHEDILCRLRDHFARAQ